MASCSVEYLRPYSLYAEDRADTIEAQLLQIVENASITAAIGESSIFSI